MEKKTANHHTFGQQTCHVKLRPKNPLPFPRPGPAHTVPHRLRYAPWVGWFAVSRFSRFQGLPSPAPNPINRVFTNMHRHKFSGSPSFKPSVFFRGVSGYVGNMLGKNVLEKLFEFEWPILRARDPFWGGEDGWLSRDRWVTDPTDDRGSPGRVQLSYT